jgi:hypothetical protein
MQKHLIHQVGVQNWCASATLGVKGVMGLKRKAKEGVDSAVKNKSPMPQARGSIHPHRSLDKYELVAPFTTHRHQMRSEDQWSSQKREHEAISDDLGLAALAAGTVKRLERTRCSPITFHEDHTKRSGRDQAIGFENTRLFQAACH